MEVEYTERQSLYLDGGLLSFIYRETGRHVIKQQYSRVSSSHSVI